MFIKQIDLYNFRIYKGPNKISLETSEDRNIVVVSGKNGFGKTTFLMSLVWCLYGKQMEKVDELYEKEIKDKGNYTKYIAGSLNRKAFEEGETEFSVSITFAGVKIPDITCNEVKITRTYNTITSSADKVEVLIDGYTNELISDLSKQNQQGEEIFIRDFILPIEIAKFFFFDAEKIVSLAEVNSNSQRRQLSKAYSEVLGIQKYEDLKANLEEKQDEYRRKSATPDEKKELNDLRSNIEKAKIEIETLENQIDELKQEKNQKEKESEDIQRRLIRVGDKMTLEELNKLKDEKTEIEKEKTAIQEKLKDFFDLIPFSLTGDTMMNISEQIINERLLSEQKYKKDDVNIKINKIRQEIEDKKKFLNFTLNIETSDFYEEQIKTLVRKHFFSELQELPETLKVLHDFSGSESNEFNQLVNNLKHSFKR